MTNLLADKTLDPIVGIGKIGGAVDPITNKTTARILFLDTLSLIIGVITVVGFIWFFLQIVTAAIAWIGSGGEKNKIQQAQKQITNGIIGVVIIISATLLIKIIETVLGINILSGVTDILTSI